MTEQPAEAANLAEAQGGQPNQGGFGSEPNQPGPEPQAVEHGPEQAGQSERLDVDRGDSEPEPVQAGQPVTIEPAATGTDEGGEGQSLPAHQDPETNTVPQSAGNQSPQLAPGPQAAAARAHALLSHYVEMAEPIMQQIERYVPASALQAARSEVSAMIKSVL